MRKEYGKCKKIACYGSAKEIAEAEEMLNGIEDLKCKMIGYKLENESQLRLQIQDAMEYKPIKATILVDGNTVYPFSKVIREYSRYLRSSRIDNLTDYFYKFLIAHFDIAHYDKHGFIAYYGGKLAPVQKLINQYCAPGWYSDLSRILEFIKTSDQQMKKIKDALIKTA